MTEAFEIGVSLALQDGVSDAIAKARRDVAALEHTVRNSGVSLRSLRDVGTRAASVAFTDKRGAAAVEPTKRVEQESPPRVEKVAAPAPPTAMLTTVSAPGRDVVSDMPKHDMTTKVGESDSASRPLPIAGVAEALHTWDGRMPAPPAVEQHVAPPRDARAASLPMAPTPAAPVMQQAEPQTPLAAVQVPLQADAPTAHFDNGADKSSQLQAVVTNSVRHVTLLNALRLSGGHAGVPQITDSVAGGTADVPAVSNDATAAQTGPGTALQPTAPLGAAPSGAVTSQTGAEDTRQASQAGDAGPHEGDVFLDGMLVGRWMSRFLNREAERASAGPTGFDARRGRLLPGVTVGG